MLHGRMNEEFDPVYMAKLFDYGHQLAENGYPWDKAPPGFVKDSLVVETVQSGKGTAQ
jgi:hypothetical protein